MTTKNPREQSSSSSGAPAAADIAVSLEKIASDLSRLNRNAAACGEAFEKLWRVEAVRKDPEARSALMSMARATTPKRFGLHLEQLSDRVYDLAPQAKRASQPLWPVARRVEASASASRFEDRVPQRTFLVL